MRESSQRPRSARILPPRTLLSYSLALLCLLAFSWHKSVFVEGFTFARTRDRTSRRPATVLPFLYRSSSRFDAVADEARCRHRSRRRLDRCLLLASKTTEEPLEDDRKSSRPTEASRKDYEEKKKTHETSQGSDAPAMYSEKEVGGYDPSERIGVESVNVGDPQIKVKEKEQSVTAILKELAAIQQQGPQKYCILGTRHCSYLHQQIIELLAYALVLSGNHVYTSGAGGTHAATIRGALRAERPDLLTVVLPQSMGKQTKESQKLLQDVEDVVTMPQNDEMPLDIASRICNSYLLSQTDQLISFAFHESSTVIEATKEAKKLDMLVTVLFLD